MSDIIDKLFSGLLLIFAIAVGFFAWTQGIKSNAESIKNSKQLQVLNKEYNDKIDNLTNRLEAIDLKISSISELTLAEKEALDVKLQVADIKKQYQQVTSLMKIVQDNPEKVFEFKDIKLRQETDSKVFEQKIASLDKTVSVQLSSLTSQIETAKFYNNILIGIVILMLGVTWRQSRLQHTHNNQIQPTPKNGAAD
ncbi:hypothetical protein [Photobacterium leiognathi]|uniref:hypothetical protein n=1 Tax=Photobacterium leiognathi TaxID=553611 RepID=UPI000D15EB26|nr:hypothetical protein [Photobacterium leiognathi]PSW49607.1 hypothetical protein C0W50_20840 [Photobacterium leiognathi subsp. mandapamensis]